VNHHQTLSPKTINLFVYDMNIQSFTDVPMTWYNSILHEAITDWDIVSKFQAEETLNN